MGWPSQEKFGRIPIIFCPGLGLVYQFCLQTRRAAGGGAGSLWRGRGKAPGGRLARGIWAGRRGGAPQKPWEMGRHLGLGTWQGLPDVVYYF
ncbi:hypothetical protein D5272_08070 [bacterium D16-76]|nr:hypothetical protein [bacterium D16-76]